MSIQHYQPEPDPAPWSQVEHVFTLLSNLSPSAGRIVGVWAQRVRAYFGPVWSRESLERRQRVLQFLQQSVNVPARRSERSEDTRGEFNLRDLPTMDEIRFSVQPAFSFSSSPDFLDGHHTEEPLRVLRKDELGSLLENIVELFPRGHKRQVARQSGGEQPRHHQEEAKTRNWQQEACDWIDQFKASDIYRRWSQLSLAERKWIEEKISLPRIKGKIANCRERKSAIEVENILPQISYLVANVQTRANQSLHHQGSMAPPTLPMGHHNNPWHAMPRLANAHVLPPTMNFAQAAAHHSSFPQFHPPPQVLTYQLPLRLQPLPHPLMPEHYMDNGSPVEMHHDYNFGTNELWTPSDSSSSTNQRVSYFRRHDRY
ncbi:uncharacterized protein JCM6883_003303 [Sporobolomyces salmoneus]|uniref:uncharacterized protein n=1 Tax=Sporobolomyces salmoneus TaxID=183962 RepID=UPI00316CEFCF